MRCAAVYQRPMLTLMRTVFSALALVLALAAPLTAATHSQAYGQAMANAQAAMAAGAMDTAAAAGRAAFAAAPDTTGKITAARLIAAAHFRAKQYFRAEFWLRRAWQLAADNGPARQAVAADFAGLRAANPVSVQLSFSAAPNSNINNGSQSETITIWGLPFVLNPDARALAGYEVFLGAEIAYRLPTTGERQSQIGLRANARSYALSAAAAAAAPDVSGADYAFASAEAFFTHRWQAAGMPGPTNFNASLGKTWYGGAPYTRFARLSLGQEFPLGDATSGAVSLGLERQISDSAGGTASTIAQISLQSAQRLGNGDQLRLNLGFETTSSVDVFTRNRAARIGLGYALAQPIWNTNVSFDLGLERREWAVSVYDPSGRQDLSLSLGVNVAIPQATVYGFTPVIKAEARQSESNIDLFDRLSYGLRLGLETRF